MDLFIIAVVLIVVGVLLYLINQFVPMEGKIKTILNWAVIIIVVLWLIKASGLLSYLKSIHT